MKKLALAYEHRDFFSKNRWIEFDTLLDSDELGLYEKSVRSLIAKRLNVADQKIETHSFEKLYLQGRDLWREEPVIKKFEAHPQIAKIIGELTLHRGGIRFGFDQFLMQGKSISPLSEKGLVQQGFSPAIFQGLSLNEIFPIQGIVAGVFIKLPSRSIKVKAAEKKIVEEESQDEVVLVSPIAKQEGGVVIVDPSLPLDWSQFELAEGEGVVMALFAAHNAVYICQEKDPLTHYLKSTGCVFGDKLSDKHHLLLIRS